MRKLMNVTFDTFMSSTDRLFDIATNFQKKGDYETASNLFDVWCRLIDSTFEADREMEVERYAKSCNHIHKQNRKRTPGRR